MKAQPPVFDVLGWSLRGKIPFMIRIREIVDPELRQRVVAALAERRGCSPAAIPDWFELDDADYVDLLDDIREGADLDPPDDVRA